MFYIYFIIITTLIVLFIPIYNNSVKKQNDIIVKNNREFNENIPYKTYLPKVTNNVAWVYVIGVFIIFIMGRISLCGLTEHEYKKQDVVIPNNELVIDVNNNNCFMYIENKLFKLNMNYIDVIVDENADNPHIKNYYTRTIKQPAKHPKRYFLFNRKETKISEWEETHNYCGCGVEELTLVLPSRYNIKTK